jgi:hypothetical protein
MWKSRRLLGEISKGLVERVGKPAFGFPRFPQRRHFHSSLSAETREPSNSRYYGAPGCFLFLLCFSRKLSPFISRIWT